MFIGDGAKVHLLVCHVILQEFRRISLSGYVLNAEQDGFYFLSLSRHHPQRIQASRRLSKPAAALPAVEPCSSVGRPEEAMLEREAAYQPLEADSEVRGVCTNKGLCPRPVSPSVAPSVDFFFFSLSAE